MFPEFSMASASDDFNFSDVSTTTASTSSSLYLPSSEPSFQAPVVDPSLMEVSHANLFIDALSVRFQLTSEEKGDLQGLHQVSLFIGIQVSSLFKYLHLLCEFSLQHLFLAD
jgi:hypothetical protein